MLTDKRDSETAIICLSGGKGGMELDAIKLANLLCNKFPIVLICKKNSFLHTECLENNSNIPIETINFFSKAFSLSIIFNLRKLIKERNISNVIFFGASELKSMYFSFLGKDINVVVRHGTTKSSSKKDWLHRLIYSCVNNHVAISDHINKNVAHIFPIRKGVGINTIYPSFQVNIDIKTKRDSETFKIIHVGRIASGKGQVDAVKACKVLYDKKINFQLDIIGDVDDVEYSEKLSEVIDSCEYKNNVKISPAVRNINEIYNSADILLFPSYGEGLGNVFIEALASGLVCITYDNTTFPEFKKIGFYFHMVETGNTVELANKLKHVIDNYDDEFLYAKENIEKIDTCFSKNKELENWQKLLS